ncbi:hypothetical protein LCGC14_2270080 [marine sediment metagenome]|uniref:Uncharacterized protein n=1 Tax=marine sediment metagenome TaxID=412755 RepID=A0A0F9CXJ4_9ZZZZ
MKIAIDCPHHGGEEILEMPENFLGETLCHPVPGKQPQPLKMAIVNGKIQELWPLLPEPSPECSPEQRAVYWKGAATWYYNHYYEQVIGRPVPTHSVPEETASDKAFKKFVEQSDG